MAIAIIAEYNPFHNGHIYQLEYAKKNFPNDEIVIILSGKYVQRGEIAIATFEERKEMALAFGASRVIELPFEYATQAAHIFAQGAIAIIAREKIDKLLFGSESNDVANLLNIAKTIKDHEEEYNSELKACLKLGHSFPKSAALALTKLMNQEVCLPNDILGLEYIKQIVNNNYSITPYTLKRTVAHHADGPCNIRYASASYIRKLIKEQGNVSMYTPMKFDNRKTEWIENYYPKFQEIIKEKTPEELAKVKLVSEGMEYLFKKHINEKTYEDFVSRVNSRRYTSSRIKRVMLYILLNINN